MLFWDFSLSQMDFNSMDTLLADFVLMDTSESYVCLLPPTHSLVEMHLDVTPARDIDIQLVTCLMSLMTDSCPERLFHHLCCNIPDDLFCNILHIFTMHSHFRYSKCSKHITMIIPLTCHMGYSSCSLLCTHAFKLPIAIVFILMPAPGLNT